MWLAEECENVYFQVGKRDGKEGEEKNEGWEKGGGVRMGAIPKIEKKC